jgi:hypothetical protein
LFSIVAEKAAGACSCPADAGGAEGSGVFEQAAVIDVTAARDATAI